MPMPTALIASLLLASSAGDIGYIKKETVGETCHVAAVADDGPLQATVTWAPCGEVDIRVMTVAALEEAGKLERAPKEIASLLRKAPYRALLTAWGEFSASLYFRCIGCSADTTEVTISD